MLRRMRWRQQVSLVLLLFFAVCTVIFLRNGNGLHYIRNKNGQKHPTLSPATTASHPIYQLFSNADSEFRETLRRQSKSLGQAVAEYKRRYKVNPPPNFDKWYEFARARGVELIDEFDTIYDSLLPFWALPPQVIRDRAEEALGFDNALIGVAIRGGKVVNTTGDKPWQEQSTSDMMQDFVEFLPDMDLAFNKHDEPRVILASEDLARLVNTAKDAALPAALSVRSPRNSFSERPADLHDGSEFPRYNITRFNRFAHQPTWTLSRMSCPVDSPARSLSEAPEDNHKSYTYSAVNLIRNRTAFTDICNSPSFASTFGFFERPNAFDVTHDLFPIFSQSKVSSFQDIVYPSPWYWSEKVKYTEMEDFPWDEKVNQLYWRGSTTGGFSRDGGWKRQHRQRVVFKMNNLDNTVILQNITDGTVVTGWQEREVPRIEYSSLFDVHFSHIGQCDPGDCDEQRSFFAIAAEAAQNHAWVYKYLLDVDGNAFSGRFYAFLKSKSLTMKMAVFREWHEEWIRPWLHYVPLGLRGDEYVEVMRYFDQEVQGRALAKEIALGSRDWAGRVLRNSDFEVWFFRLLLEYGRLVDKDREIIGYTG
jgi:hypothetical protein